MYHLYYTSVHEIKNMLFFLCYFINFFSAFLLILEISTSLSTILLLYIQKIPQFGVNDGVPFSSVQFPNSVQVYSIQYPISFYILFYSIQLFLMLFSVQFSNSI